MIHARNSDDLDNIVKNAECCGISPGCKLQDFWKKLIFPKDYSIGVEEIFTALVEYGSTCLNLKCVDNQVVVESILINFEINSSGQGHRRVKLMDGNYLKFSNLRAGVEISVVESHLNLNSIPFRYISYGKYDIPSYIRAHNGVEFHFKARDGKFLLDQLLIS